MPVAASRVVIGFVSWTDEYAGAKAAFGRQRRRNRNRL